MTVLEAPERERALELEVYRLRDELATLRHKLQRSPRHDIGLDFNVTVEVVRDGVNHVERVHNLVTISGRNIIRDLLGRGTPGTGAGYAPTHIALGTGTSATVKTMTDLESEAFRGAITQRFGGEGKIVYQIFLDKDEGNDGNPIYTEAALFDNSGAGLGNMLSRVTFSPVQKTTSVQLVITWEISITAV